LVARLLAHIPLATMDGKYDANTGLPVDVVPVPASQQISPSAPNFGGPPAYGQPVAVQGQPAYGHPVPAQAVYGQPVAVQGQPTYGQPVPISLQNVQPTITVNAQVGQPTSLALDPPFGGGTALERWGGSICGCGDNCGTCCVALFCPCVVYGQNMQAMFGHRTSCAAQALFYLATWLIPAAVGCPGCCCFLTCTSRKQIDEKLSSQSSGSTLPENDCNACCCHFFCEACALAQEARAIRAWLNAGGQVSGPGVHF